MRYHYLVYNRRTIDTHYTEYIEIGVLWASLSSNLGHTLIRLHGAKILVEAVDLLVLDITHHRHNCYTNLAHLRDLTYIYHV